MNLWIHCEKCGEKARIGKRERQAPRSLIALFEGAGDFDWPDGWMQTIRGKDTATLCPPCARVLQVFFDEAMAKFWGTPIPAVDGAVQGSILPP